MTCRYGASGDPALGFPQVHEQQRDRGRRHARDPRGLADVARPDSVELLADLIREPAHERVIEVRRQRRRVVTALLLDLVPLAHDVARVAGLDLEAADAKLRGLGLERAERARLADARQ